MREALLRVVGHIDYNLDLDGLRAVKPPRAALKKLDGEKTGET